MNGFFPNQDVKLKLETAAEGLVFLFHRSNDETGELVQVRQSWASVHRLLSRLRKSQRYCAKDVPLLVWKQGDELHIKFHDPEHQTVEECVFSGEESWRILAMLERLPGLN